MKERKKRSVIWQIPVEELQELVSNSKSFTDILRFFNLRFAGGNHRTLQRRLKEEGIEHSHIITGIDSNKNNRRFGSGCKLTPIDEILIEHCSYNRGRLKKRLIALGLLVNECYECHLKPFWNNKDLVLILDHINGTYDDNRLENLRLLCPNCNSQTATFAGRNKKNHWVVG